MAGPNFWENDPVVTPAPAQGGPRPVYTAPDPQRDIENARNDRKDAVDQRDQVRKDAANAWTVLTPAEVAELGLAKGKSYRRNGLGKIELIGDGDATGNQRAITESLVKSLGPNWSTDNDEVSALIRSSTSGGLESRGADVAGFFGVATDGMENIGRLETIASDLTLQLTGGSLGAQISNSDRDFIISRIGNIANREVPAEQRLAAWDQVKKRFANIMGLPAENGDPGTVPANAMTRLRIGNPTSPGPAGPDATETSTPYPPEMITAHDQMVAQLMMENGGRLDPQGYAAAKAALSKRFGYETSSTDADIAWATSINEYLDAGGRTVPGGIEAPTRDMTLIEQGLNTAADSSVGAYFGGAANALTGGTLDEIAGASGGEGAAQQAQWAKETMRSEHPIASFAGETTGAALAMIPVARGAQAVGRTALAGEMAYGGAYGAGDNNDNRLLGAAAAAAGAKAGDWLGGKLLQRFNRKIPADAADEAVNQGAGAVPDALTPAQRYARAQEQGVDLSIGDVRGMGAKAAERVLDVQPGSAGVMNAARNETRRQLGEAADSVAAGYGSAATPASMGEAAQAGARKWIARAKGEKGNPLDRGIIGRAYDAIPIAPGSPAQREATLSALEEINQEFSSNPKLRELMKDTQAARLLEALGDAGSELSWSDLKALRSAVGEDMNSFRIGSQGSRQSTLSRLYGALSEDMRATAAARGPAALAKFERANSLNRAVEARIEGTLTAILGRDGMQSPERAAAKLRAMTVSGRATADFRQLAEIRKSMPADEWGEVSGALIRLMGQPLGSEGRDFAAETFVRNFDDMSSAAKNLLFGGGNSALRKNLDEFAEVARDAASSNATRNTSNTAMGISGGLGFLAGGVPALVGQAVTSYGAAKLWTHPPFVRWATGYTRMMNRAAATSQAPSEAAVKSQLAHLDRIAKASGPVSAEVIVLRDYLANAASQSPERLAAEPTEGDRQ